MKNKNIRTIECIHLLKTNWKTIDSDSWIKFTVQTQALSHKSNQLQSHRFKTQSDSITRHTKGSLTDRMLPVLSPKQATSTGFHSPKASQTDFKLNKIEKTISTLARSSFDKLQQKILEIQSLDDRQLIDDLYQENKQFLLPCLIKKDLNTLLELWFKQIKEIMMTQNLIIIAYFFYFIARVSKEFEKLEFTIYFLQQTLIFCIFSSRLMHLKMRCYLQLSECARSMQLIPICEKFLNKYSWFLKDDSIEIKVYELLGICYYYYGDVETAYYFHNRAVINHLEDDSSIEKQFSNQLLKDYQTSHLNEPTLSYLIINKMNMPNGLRTFYQKININKRASLGSQINDDNEGFLKLRLDSFSMIEKIVQDPEFHFQVYPPKKVRTIESFVNKREKFFDKLRRDVSYSIQNFGPLKERKIFHENLKTSLDEQIKKRIEEDQTTEIMNSIKIKKSKLQQEMKTRVRISHLSRYEIRTLNLKQKSFELLEDFVNDMINQIRK